MAKEKSQFANFIMKRTPYDLKGLAEILEASYSNGSNNTKFLTKKTFSPSQLGYGSGACPRRWHMAFTGAEFVNEYSSKSVDNMEAGTDRHERIQRNLHNSNLTWDTEWDLWSDGTSPIHGYVDAIIRDHNGFDIVVEIKTTNTQVFTIRRAQNKIPDYQALQLLLYMDVLGIRHGLILLEDRNTFEKALFPLEMTEENQEKVDNVKAWMSEVYEAFKNDTLPTIPYKSNSRVCKECPLSQWCKTQPEGNIDIAPLKFSLEELEADS